MKVDVARHQACHPAKWPLRFRLLPKADESENNLIFFYPGYERGQYPVISDLEFFNEICAGRFGNIFVGKL